LKKKRIAISLLALLVLGTIILGGCTTETPPKIEDLCIALCQAEKAKGTDLSNGPCIGNPLKENSDWVCDVAHSPRTSADNQPENQCSAFMEGKAKHFVEVDEDCKVIKEY